MADAPAPYRSSRRFASLASYRQNGVPDDWWAAQQFRLEVHRLPSRDEASDSHCRLLFEALDSLPLQVKDLIRHSVDHLRLDPLESFHRGSIGCWSVGTIRLNADWSRLEALGPEAEGPEVAAPLLRAVLLHESGHALVEDPRNGVPLQAVIRLIAAGGWLPHPLEDPVPFGETGQRLSRLTGYYLDRLSGVDPRWRGELPLGSPGTPAPLQLDRDLMWRVPLSTAQVTSGRGCLRLRNPNQLARELRSNFEGARLDRELARVGLGRDQVERVLRLRPSPSPYAEEMVAETPAEIFRVVHSPLVRGRPNTPAREEGERLLVEPWRAAERIMGPRTSPARPWRTLEQLTRSAAATPERGGRGE